jgi:hypothetical protein
MLLYRVYGDRGNWDRAVGAAHWGRACNAFVDGLPYCYDINRAVFTDVVEMATGVGSARGARVERGRVTDA